MNAGTDVEVLLRQEHIRPEELLTDGPNNNLNGQINTEETTVGNTKGKKQGKKTTIVHVRRTMVITSHEDVLRMFLPMIAFCASLLMFIHSIFAVVMVFFGPVV